MDSAALLESTRWKYEAPTFLFLMNCNLNMTVCPYACHTLFTQKVLFVSMNNPE